MELVDFYSTLNMTERISQVMDPADVDDDQEWKRLQLTVGLISDTMAGKLDHRTSLGAAEQTIVLSL